MTAIRKRVPRRSSIAPIVAAALVVVGCQGEQAAAPAVTSPATTLGAIVASPVNVIMAVGDTFTVHVQGTAVDGTPLAAFDSVVYSLNSIVDTARITVSPTGTITARAASTGAPVFVNVFAFKGGAAAADQVVIQVTPTSFSGATLSIQPSPFDSTRVALGADKSITPVIQNADGSLSVPNPQLRLSSSVADTKKIGCYLPNLPSNTQAFTYLTTVFQLTGCAGSFGLNQFRSIATGTAWVHARALVYGTMLEDSVQYTITNSFMVFAGAWNNNLEMVCGECYATIAPGGTIVFQNGFASGLGLTATFTLDNPAAATAANPPATAGDTAGNVTTLQPFEQSPRVFLTPGTYHWTEHVNGAVPPFVDTTFTGTIVVQ
jgi:hypothetical protein